MPRRFKHVFDKKNPKAAFAIIVTTYGAMVRRNLIVIKGETKTRYKSNIRGRFRVFIGDEAHMMKNPDTRAARCVMKTDAPVRLLVTATPIMHGRRDLIGFLQLCWSDHIASEIYDWEVKQEGYSGTSLWDEEGLDLYKELIKLDPTDPRRYYALNPQK
jgi:SNF2-related domain